MVGSTQPELGVHTGLTDIAGARPFAAIRSLWQEAEAEGFDAASIWDHFDAGARPGGGPCFEAVSLHTALACATERMRCGAFVYSASHRPATVLAKAITTIDHVAEGRAEIGIGAGWADVEHEAYGFPWGTPKERLDRLEETLEIVTGLLRRGEATLDGTYARAAGAVNDPPPVQGRIPIWVGGRGERRTLRIVAKWADGWNCGYQSPEGFAHKLSVLHEHCAAIGRDPAELSISVNLVAATDERELEASFRGVVDRVRDGALVGSTAQIAETMDAYVRAGADRINAVLRSPHPPGLLHSLAEARRKLLAPDPL